MWQQFLAFTIKATEINVPTSTANVGVVLSNTVKLLISVVGMASVIAFIVGGVFYAMSHGDAKLVQRAKDTIMWAIAGLILSIAAYGIVIFVSNAFGGKGPN